MDHEAVVAIPLEVVPSRYTVLTHVRVPKRLHCLYHVLWQRVVAEVHSYVDDRLGPQPRHRGTADVLHLASVVTKRLDKGPANLPIQGGPSLVVIGNIDAEGHALVSSKFKVQSSKSKNRFLPLDFEL